MSDDDVEERCDSLWTVELDSEVRLLHRLVVVGGAQLLDGSAAHPHVVVLEQAYHTTLDAGLWRPSLLALFDQESAVWCLVSAVC